MTSYKIGRINFRDDVYRASCKEGPTSHFIHLEMQEADLETHRAQVLAVGPQLRNPGRRPGNCSLCYTGKDESHDEYGM